MEHARNIQCRCVADVVGVGFEGGAENGDAHAGQVAAGHFGDEVHGALAPPLVDGVHFLQEPDRLPDAEFPGPVREGADVLREAAAAETQARLEEAAADAAVVGERLRQDVDVRAGRLADLRHRVDVGDLGGEEGVRRPP